MGCTETLKVDVTAMRDYDISVEVDKEKKYLLRLWYGNFSRACANEVSTLQCVQY